MQEHNAGLDTLQETDLNKYLYGSFLLVHLLNSSCATF